MRGRLERKCFHELLGCPMSGGMLGHVEVHNLATVMAEDDEYLENTKRGCRDRKQINCR